MNYEEEVSISSLSFLLLHLTFGDNFCMSNRYGSILPDFKCYKNKKRDALGNVNVTNFASTYQLDSANLNYKVSLSIWKYNPSKKSILKIRMHSSLSCQINCQIKLRARYILREKLRCCSIGAVCAVHQL